MATQIQAPSCFPDISIIFFSRNQHVLLHGDQRHLAPQRQALLHFIEITIRLPQRSASSCSMETSLLGFAGNLYYQHRSSTVLTITAEKCTGRKSPAKFSGKHIPMIRGVVAFKRAATSLRISAGLERFMAKHKQLEQFLLARILKIEKTGFSGCKCTGFLFPGLVSRIHHRYGQLAVLSIRRNHY